MSLFALQFAHALGARALVTSSSDEKLAQARELGAGDTLNYARIPAWDDEILARTGGRGVDHVIEVVGGENLNRSLRAVRVSGHALRPVADRVFPFSEVPEALRYLESGKHFGKVVVTMAT